MIEIRWTRATRPSATLVLAHGAGAAMDSPFLERFAAAASLAGLDVARFEFPYMAARREDGKKRPPPRAEKLIGSYVAALDLVREGSKPLLIGGKSLGGRVAAMAAGDPVLSGRVAGVVCLGYPFHPTGRPERLRLKPLQSLRVPCLICQGERDPFGSRAEIAEYELPGTVELLFLDDGNHDLAPRGLAEATWDGNLRRAAEATSAFAKRLGTG